MSTLSELERYATRHYCPDCPASNRLVVHHDRASKSDYVACNNCGRREGFTRAKTATDIYWEHPDALPLTIQNTLARKHEAKIEASIEGMPVELANKVRQRYGLPLVEE